MAKHLATAVCSWRGHVLPAAHVRSVEHAAWVGIDLPQDGSDRPWRLARCLRCDAWMPVHPPDEPEAETLPVPDQLQLPRRDGALRSAVIMRLIAIERGVHSVFFLLAAVLAILLRTELSSVQSWVRHWLTQLTSNLSGTGNAFNNSFLVREGNHLLRLKPSTLNVVIAVAVAYCVVEGVEAVGLWLERRWAEYLTVVATAGFVPFEVYELTKRVSALKVVALVLNLLILAYLVWSKELFGLGRVRHRGPDDRRQDPNQVLAQPITRDATV